MRALLTPIFLLLLASSSFAQAVAVSPAPPLPRGQVIESVASVDDPAETYALYLPLNYTPDRPWPIIYAFDPLARGVVPVRRYKDIAEKYEFILAGSNNSRNFSLQESSKAASAIWDDTHLRLALDSRRAYTTGFSGGARMAGIIAFRCAPCRIAGVIAHGAGYPLGEQPTAKNSPIYFLAVGDEDFNWPEVVQVRRAREQSGLPYRAEVFHGPHQWAPTSVFEDAVVWIQLKSMQSGVQPRNNEFIDTQFTKTQAALSDAVDRGETLAQLGALQSLVSDFEGLKEVSSFRQKLTDLKVSPALSRALKQEDSAINSQQASSSVLFSELGQLETSSSEDRDQLRSLVVDQMVRLKHDAARAKSDDKRLPLVRAFSSVQASYIESGQAQFEQKHYDLAEFYFQIVSDVSPEEIWPVLLLAETSAARGNRKQAISRLRQTAKLGLNNPEAYQQNRNLQNLQNDPEYKTFLSELRSETRK